MRETKFRGKSTSSCEIANEGDWVYGNLIIDGDQAYIVNGVSECNYEYIAIEEWCPIDPNTVGQYVGLKDRLNAEIYEGDIMRLKNSKGQTANHQEVYWNNELACFGWRTANDDSWPDSFTGFYDDYAVIGNIYENPELLK